MSLSQSSKVEDIIHAVIYLIASLEAENEVAGFVADIEPHYNHLLAEVGKRNQADNVEVKADAVRRNRRRKLGATVTPFHLKTCGHFGSKSHEDVVRIFQTSPSAITNTPEKDFPTVIRDMRTRILAPATPKEVVKDAAPFLAAADAYLKAMDADAAAKVALEEAKGRVNKAKTACLNGLAVVRGRLIAFYPRQQETIASFFLANRSSSSPKPEPASVTPLHVLEKTEKTDEEEVKNG